jgi:hypothetical protein
MSFSLARECELSFAKDFGSDSEIGYLDCRLLSLFKSARSKAVAGREIPSPLAGEGGRRMAAG